MKIDRQALWKRYNGHCAYCGTEIALNDMQTDHIKPKVFGGDSRPENIMPSCRSCNHYKRDAAGLEGFREKMNTLHERIEKIYIIPIAIRYGMMDEFELKPFDGKFYFEKL